MIFIIIPVFNRWEFTKGCLKSLQFQTQDSVRVVVVDHGSTDGTSEYILKEFPNVQILKGDSSMWWTAATNLGIKYALENNATFILTLNNDLVVDSNYVSELLSCYNRNKPCIIGSTSIEIDDKSSVHFCGVRWNSLTAKYAYLRLKYNNINTLQSSHDVVDTDLLPGRGVLFPAEVFAKLGFFDEENFPQYMADEDFSLRCKKNGYKLLVSTHAIVLSYTKATGLTNLHIKKRYRYWKDLFFSIRSPNNIRTRWRWAARNSSFPVVYLCFDYLRIIYSKVFKGI